MWCSPDEEGDYAPFALRKAGVATKGGLAELAEALRKSAEQVAAQRPSGNGGFAAMDRLASRAGTGGKPAPALPAKPSAVEAAARRTTVTRAKTPTRTPAKPLPKPPSPPGTRPPP